MALIACVQIPNLPIAIARRHGLVPLDRALVGMPLRQARVRCPQATYLLAEPERDRQVIAALAALLEAFSPRVAASERLPDPALVLDLGRMTFSQASALVTRLDRRIRAEIGLLPAGMFQVESRAQAQVLPRLKPRCMGDLIVAISLIRPGPLQGDMVHPYLRRRQGIEKVVYAHPLLKPALEETLGVILFQEQVLKVARALAGFTPGQGEQLRRALGSKNAEAAIERLRAAFLRGAAAKGVPLSVAATVFEQLRAFGSYSFPKSHAAAFAVIVYQSAWLKRLAAQWLRSTWKGQVIHFDFDCAGPGWRAYDLGVFFWSLSINGHGDDVWVPFLHGYRAQRALSDADLALVPAFAALRVIWLIGLWCANAAHFGHHALHTDSFEREYWRFQRLYTQAKQALGAG